MQTRIIHKNRKTSIVHALILAAGQGQRLGFNQPKAFIRLNSKPLYAYSAEVIYSHPEIRNVVIIFPPGGKTRQDSLKIALTELEKSHNPQPNDLILIHNAANPFVTKPEIDAVLKAARKYHAAAVAHPVTDTIKSVDKKENVQKTIPRSNLRALQTPQVIKYKYLKKAMEKAEKTHFQGTDDLMLVEQIGLSPKILPASPENRKITTIQDLEWARFHLGDFPEIMTGFGEDSHPFERRPRSLKQHLKQPLKLGGLSIKTHPRLAGNSDADVVLHALCNAIAQVIGEKSLGSFADTICQNGIKDSRKYLEQIIAKAGQTGWKINHIGLSIEAKTPQIDPLSDKIKQNLSKLTKIPVENIGLTAHSGEGLTPFGRGQAIKAAAIVTMRKEN